MLKVGGDVEDGGDRRGQFYWQTHFFVAADVEVKAFSHSGMLVIFTLVIQPFLSFAVN